MRCRFKHKIFQNEENGYTIAIFTTQDKIKAKEELNLLKKSYPYNVSERS